MDRILVATATLTGSPATEAKALALEQGYTPYQATLRHPAGLPAAVVCTAAGCARLGARLELQR